VLVLLAICDDLTADMLSGPVRQLTGSSQISIRLPHECNMFRIVLRNQFLITANKGRRIVPDLEDMQSLRRRVSVVEFTVQFVPPTDYHPREAANKAPCASSDHLADLFRRAQAPLARMLLSKLPDAHARFDSTGSYLPPCTAVTASTDAFFQARAEPHEAWYRAARSSDGSHLPLLFPAPLPPLGQALADFALSEVEQDSRPRPNAASLFSSYKAYRNEHFPDAPTRARPGHKVFGRTELVEFLATKGVVFAMDTKNTKRALNFLLRENLNEEQKARELLTYLADKDAPSARAPRPR